MLIFTKITELQAFLAQTNGKKQTVGFVPTMGALHLGHISLIKASKKECDITICSIYVNPTQFNDKNDLERYPKTPEKDLELLSNIACDVVFVPTTEEMYSSKEERIFDFGYLDKILEGSHRPGHFNGVALIISKFFDIVKPYKAFFGSKDYQQVMIVKALVKQLHYDVEIKSCPILREEDGLAMSSRNALLNPDERKAAKIFPWLMDEVKALKEKGADINEIKNMVEVSLKKNSIYKLDYLAICDAASLKELNSFNEAQSYVVLIACFVGKIRLIDNIILS